MSRVGLKSLAGLLAGLLCLAACDRASATQLLLKDGRILEGNLGRTDGLAETPRAPDPDGVPPVQLIVFIDDNLRRTFVSKWQLLEPPREGTSQIFEKYRIRNPVVRSGGRTVTSVGPILESQPFDQYGRRRVKMFTTRGLVDIVQCITEITPLWTKVEGHRYVWDMRLNTNSIPREDLARILARLTPSDDIEAREKLARFYIQAERYEEALRQLESILADFPEEPGLRERLEPSMRTIKQLSAGRLLDELEMRREAGQHLLVSTLLEKFPSEGVAGNILEEVRQMTREYESLGAWGKEALKQFDALLEEIEDEALRQRIQPICEEIAAELSLNTLDRLTGFRLMLDDQSRSAEEKLALAISGWLLGGDSATVNLPLALSLFEVRQLVREYLNAGDTLSRARILKRFYSQEGGTPELVAKLLAHMKPPLETPLPGIGDQAQDATAAAPGNGDTPPGVEVQPEENPVGKGAENSSEETPQAAPPRPGYYELEVVGLAEAPPVKYLVQLPPEYDPYRRYPTIVTLHGSRTTPALQVDWWAGAWTEGGWRGGQATRHGYIVIAPQWAAEHQKKYGYSLQEHAAVLSSLRDACRRFAIDTDRVFLSGHSMGGDAAWDIGLAHPDLWAGVIPIVAQSDKYCAHYSENAKLVPFYFVCGELDGNRMSVNARDFDRYLRYSGYNCTVVEYLGRGHDSYSDEIQRLFDWMGRFKRSFFPRKFTTYTMRPWDNFFWWVELDGLPPRAMVEPVDWPPPRGTRAAKIEASITATGAIYVRGGAGSVTVWLSPEMVDFQQRITILVNGRRITSAARSVEPDLETLLEDVLLRGDRQHPFWAKVES